MPVSRMVIIRNTKTGQEGAIHPSDFTKPSLHPKGMGSYAEQGYVIERYETGEPYDGPKSQREIDQANEEKQAEKDATKAPVSAKAEPKGKAS